MTLLSQNPDDADNLPPGRAGLVASEAGPEGSGPFLPRGRACQESQEEQTHPSEPEGYPCKGIIPSFSLCPPYCPPVVSVMPPFWWPFVSLDTEISAEANSQQGEGKPFLATTTKVAKCRPTKFSDEISLHFILSVFPCSCLVGWLVGQPSSCL